MAANIPQLCFGVIVGLRLLDWDRIKRRAGKKNAHPKVRQNSQANGGPVGTGPRLTGTAVQLQRYNKKQLI